MNGMQSVRSVGRAGKSLSWVLVVVALALVGTIGLALLRRHSAPQGAPGAAAVTTGVIPPAVMAELASIPDSVWNRVGSADASVPKFVGKPDSAGAKASVLYVGALFCPYCAAARWSVITALSRFGTFTGLSLSASSSTDVFPSTPTFSFHGGSYTSQYIDFEAVETQGAEAVGGRYQPLETMTPAQEAVIRKYDGPPYLDAPGGIPFMLVGGKPAQYMWSGSPFTPQVLAGRTQSAIAATLAGGTGDAATAILVNANEITAAICAVDGNQPAAVCTSPAIAAAIKSLPAKAP